MYCEIIYTKNHLSSIHLEGNKCNYFFSTSVNVTRCDRIIHMKIKIMQDGFCIHTEETRVIYFWRFHIRILLLVASLPFYRGRWTRSLQSSFLLSFVPYKILWLSPNLLYQNKYLLRTTKITIKAVL
jgi:hypothetical protein